MTATLDKVADLRPAAVMEAEQSISAWNPAVLWSSGPSTGTIYYTGAYEDLGLETSRTGDTLLKAMIPRLKSFLMMGPGWDTYGASPISPTAARIAVAFLLSYHAYPGVSVVPTGKGGVQLEWHVGRVDVELEIMPDGRVCLLGEDASSGDREERWVGLGHPAIRSWLGRLGQTR